MPRETKVRCPAPSVVLEALEVAVREAVAAMDSRSVGRDVVEGEKRSFPEVEFRQLAGAERHVNQPACGLRDVRREAAVGWGAKNYNHVVL